METPKYRVLWSWDFGTAWDSTLFVRERGSSGKNGRRAYFLNDYMRLVDFAAKHHFNGVVIWGAVRAHENGFAQLKELVKYGRAQGVRIMPGVSAFSYGGVCYDPREKFDGVFDYPMQEHPYSMGTWLKKHPEYMAIDENGQPYPFGPMNMVACPSRKETLEWFKDGLRWLYDEFDVDGIQVEVGDYAVCHCPLCKERRKNAKVGAYYSISDMERAYNAAAEISYQKKPEAWVICETYSCIANPSSAIPKEKYQGASMDLEDRKLLKCLPEDAILQWTVDKFVGGYAMDSWEMPVYTPAKNNIVRIHVGSQWAENGPADWGTNLVWQMVKNARMQGINGMSIFGEESPFSPPNEANYLAFEEAAGLGKENPECDEELFYAQTLDPLYGGEGYAKRWRSLYIKGCMLRLEYRLLKHDNSRQPFEILTDDPDFRAKVEKMSVEQKIAVVEEYFQEAREISCHLTGEVAARWSWLENKLWSIRYVLITLPNRSII